MPGRENVGCVYRASLHVCLSVLLVWLVAACVSGVHAIPLFAPVYHVFEPQQYVRPASAPFRDAVSRAVHVFMPCAAEHGDNATTSWCHATSADYVMWKRGAGESPLPASAWYDKGGVRAGTLALNAFGEPTVMYTCVGRSGAQKQCLAGPPTQAFRRSRALSRLRKSPLNPILVGEDVPDLASVDEFRDPTAWWNSPGDADTRLIAFSASLRNASTEERRPHVVVFATTDLSLDGSYDYSHSLYTDPRSVDTMFEYPDFFAGDDTKSTSSADLPYFLKLSSVTARRDYVMRGSYAAAGSEPAVFTADVAPGPGWVDLGTLYGTKTFWDPILRKRRLWGWAAEDFANGSSLAATTGWGGVQTIRDVAYNATDATLRFPPVAEWKALRKSVVFDGTVSLTRNMARVEVVGPSAGATRYHEIIADFSFPSEYVDGSRYYTAATAPEIGLQLRASANATQYVSVSLRMPATNATGARCYTQSPYPLQRFTLPDAANDVEQCQAACDALPLCTAWDRVTKVYENVCVLQWQSSEPQRDCSATTGRPNVPLLRLSRAHSGTLGSVADLEGRAPLRRDGAPNTMRLHVYVDDSVIEVFKDDGKECLTGRVYLRDDTQQGIWVYAKNIPTELVKVDVQVFTMGSIWNSTTPPSAVENYTNSTYNLFSALMPEK